MPFVNLTPHQMNIHLGHGKMLRFAPSRYPARRIPEIIRCGFINDVPVFRSKVKKIINLPAPREGVIYIVSARVFTATDQNDVVCVGEVIKDKEGNVKYCQGLTIK